MSSTSTDTHPYTLHYRNACAIADLTSDSVIVTGGYNTMHNVSRYDLLGWVEDLPPLLNGRTDHGCGAYMKEDGSQV